jgi:hypothetical protein
MDKAMEMFGVIYQIIKDLWERLRNKPLPEKSQSIYLTRTEIDWTPYNKRANNMSLFWVCGTSLVEVAQNTLDLLISNGVGDIKIILPNTEKDTLSYDQLADFDKNDFLLDKQIKLAERAYDRIGKTLKNRQKVPHDHLRRYSGIMYSNITIYDEDAFIAFYDTAGVGDENITLRFHGSRSKGYQRVRALFEKMWGKSE